MPRYAGQQRSLVKPSLLGCADALLQQQCQTRLGGMCTGSFAFSRVRIAWNIARAGTFLSCEPRFSVSAASRTASSAERQRSLGFGVQARQGRGEALVGWGVTAGPAI